MRYPRRSERWRCRSASLYSIPQNFVVFLDKLYQQHRCESSGYYRSVVDLYDHRSARCVGEYGGVLYTLVDRRPVIGAKAILRALLVLLTEVVYRSHLKCKHKPIVVRQYARTLHPLIIIRAISTIVLGKLYQTFSALTGDVCLLTFVARPFLLYITVGNNDGDR